MAGKSFPARRSVLLVAALAALSVSACGRRGDLEPPNASATPAPANKRNVDVHHTTPKITPPNKSFVLDPVLQ